MKISDRNLGMVARDRLTVNKIRELRSQTRSVVESGAEGLKALGMHL